MHLYCFQFSPFDFLKSHSIPCLPVSSCAHRCLFPHNTWDELEGWVRVGNMTKALNAQPGEQSASRDCIHPKSWMCLMSDISYCNTSYFSSLHVKRCINTLLHYLIIRHHSRWPHLFSFFFFFPKIISTTFCCKYRGEIDGCSYFPSWWSK